MFRTLLASLSVLLLSATATLSQDISRLTLTGRFEQGGMVVGNTLPGSQLTLDGKLVRVSDDGWFVFGFGRDHGSEAVLRASYPDGTIDERRLEIASRTYDIQRIDGLPPQMVTPLGDEVLARIRRNAAEVREARAVDTPSTWFLEEFIWPAQGRISGVFGSQRILNGEPRRPHYGVDIAAPTGTPVVAPAGGVVRLAATDHYYTGGTIILDHGHGLSSAFLHMDTVTVKVGDQVAKGDPLGTIGAAGRATGPHLDWRINWFDERLDPAQLVPPLAAAD